MKQHAVSLAFVVGTLLAGAVLHAGCQATQVCATPLIGSYLLVHQAKCQPARPAAAMPQAPR